MMVKVCVLSVFILLAHVASASMAPYAISPRGVSSRMGSYPAWKRWMTSGRTMGRQYTADDCVSDDECASPRGCFNDQDEPCSLQDSVCVCMELDYVYCDDSSQCLARDRCVSTMSSGRHPTPNPPVCISCDLFDPDVATAVDDGLGSCDAPEEVAADDGDGEDVPDQGGDDSDAAAAEDDAGAADLSAVADDDGTGTDETAPCIAVSSLQDVKQEDLVFAKHLRAIVLCDGLSNCATAGHMVVFDGRAMSMKTYCDVGASEACTKRTTWVNSPKMRKGLRVRSRAEQLEFTALSARFNTKVEEHVLSALIHAGV